jgi:FMN reductase
MIKPHIVGIGGTLRPASTSEVALQFALKEAASLGATVAMLTGNALLLPMYAPEDPQRREAALPLLSEISRAHGIILSSPGYHGSLSGLLKNALDYVEDLRDDARPYFHGRAVGLIACAYGWQATGTTLMTMRSVVHALRGWPTPLGVAINSSVKSFASGGEPTDANVASQLRSLARQVVEFTSAQAALEHSRNALLSCNSEVP